MGRGSSGSAKNIAAVRVTYDNGVTLGYRNNPYGGLFDQTRMEPIETKLTLADIVRRSKAQGYQVETLTRKQMEESDAARREERANRPDYELGVGIPGGNAQWRKAARRQKIVDRAQRRRGR